MAERVYLTVGEVLEIHLQQIDDYGGAHGLRDKGLLESPVFRPQIGYYNTIAEEAAALMESLGVRPKIDFLRTDPTREVIHIGLSSTVGVV